MQKLFERISAIDDDQQGNKQNEQSSVMRSVQALSHQQGPLRNFLMFLEETNVLKAKTVNFRKYKAILGPIYRELITVDQIRDLMFTNFKRYRCNQLISNYSTAESKQWSKNDIVILLWITEKYNILNKKIQEQYTMQDWTRVSSMIPGKTAHLCLFKWLSFFKNPLDKHPWTLEEDEILRDLVVDQQQTDWTEVSQKLYLGIKQDPVFRSGKQCKERYSYHLNPKIKKGHWSVEEDLKLIRLYLEEGNKWQKIAAKMDGRTENSIKNRINVILQKNIVPLLGPEQSIVQKTREYIRLISARIELPNGTASVQQPNSNVAAVSNPDFKAPTVKEQQEQRQNGQNDNVSSTYARINDDHYFTFTTIEQQKSVKFVSFIPTMSIQQLLSYDNICSAIFCKENKTILYKDIAFGRKFNNTEDRFFQQQFLMENIQELDDAM